MDKIVKLFKEVVLQSLTSKLAGLHDPDTMKDRITGHLESLCRDTNLPKPSVAYEGVTDKGSHRFRLKIPGVMDNILAVKPGVLRSPSEIRGL